MLRFDDQHYLFLHADVRQSKFAPAPLEHYLVWGKQEGREARFLKPGFLELHSAMPVEKGKISLIMLCQETIDQRAVESILGQTHKHLELIFVGGRPPVVKDSRVRFIESKEWLPAKRFNQGILQSTGEFIAFAFNNTELSVDCLEQLIASMTENIMLTSGQVLFVDYRQTEEVVYGERLGPKNFSQIVIPNSAVLVRKSLFENIGYFDETNEFVQSEDQEMWSRIYFHKQKSVFIPRVLGKQYWYSTPTHMDRKLACANLVFRYNCFDENYYIEQNPDVKAAVNGGMFKSGLDHFLNFGYREYRFMCNPTRQILLV